MAMTHDYLDYLEDQIGISPANSQEELQAAQTIADLMKKHDVDVNVEEFDAPGSGRFVRCVLLVLMFVGVILSGMSNEEQLLDNLRTFETDAPLTGEEREALLSMAGEMTRRTALPCTACRYCTTHCPMSLNIPWLLELYNEHVFTGGGFIAPMALMAVPDDKKPSACLGCRSCEQVCPQQIRISEALADFSAMLKG